MKRYSSLLLILLLFVLISCRSQSMLMVYEFTQLNEPKRYILKKQATHADFDYSKLEDIDGYLGLFKKPKKIIAAFEPVKGKYNYYQFMATYKGSSYNDGKGSVIKDFNDILIIKTNDENQIVDAYQYTLEWAEPPFQYDVFKSSAKNIKLTDNLDIEKLQLKRTNTESK
ncbi:hypothetical protein [Flavobacterium sp. 9AF]|uniref:hypothetical protein n=1 Tax=Flavobacterium sp. 9AF TaxID=2653142 RepID=UPI00135A1E1C|nr:hypothetical protein [Flavobacterium sp. 9AF]